MTENKRFTLEKFGLNFIVNDNGRNLTAKQTVDKLNQLYEENKQLKSYTGEMEDYLARLEEKNEKLKEENNDLIKLINDLGSEEMDRQMEEILE